MAIKNTAQAAALAALANNFNNSLSAFIAACPATYVVCVGPVRSLGSASVGTIVSQIGVQIFYYDARTIESLPAGGPWTVYDPHNLILIKP